MIVEGFETSVLGLFIYFFFFFFPQIFIITVTHQETITKTARPQALKKSSDWGNDIGGGKYAYILSILYQLF